MPSFEGINLMWEAKFISRINNRSWKMGGLTALKVLYINSRWRKTPLKLKKPL
jgi:hypothetical protein